MSEGIRYAVRFILLASFGFMIGMFVNGPVGAKSAPVPIRYVANLMIYHQADPETTVLENTLGAIVDVQRVAAGTYHITANVPVFTIGHTTALTQYIRMTPGNTVMADISCPDEYYCILKMFYMDSAGNALQAYDSGSADRYVPVEITVYP